MISGLPELVNAGISASTALRSSAPTLFMLPFKRRRGMGNDPSRGEALQNLPQERVICMAWSRKL